MIMHPYEFSRQGSLTLIDARSSVGGSRRANTFARVSFRQALGTPFNLSRWKDVPRTSRIFLPQNCNISSILSIFKYNPKGEANNKFITS